MSMTISHHEKFKDLNRNTVGDILLKMISNTSDLSN